MTDRRQRHSTKKDINERYFAWLCDLVDVNQGEDSYYLLARVLHNRPFNIVVANDENRAADGKYLREQFNDDENRPHYFEDFSDHCTMLELIIGLAYRCEFIMADQYGNIPMDEWFWKLISNIRLDEFTDENWYDHTTDLIVNDRLSMIINRTYDKNGKGGLFPLKYYQKDQRKIELWYQMSSYLVENYY